ncbi:MAG: hypothetical protein ABSC24_13715 [Verrucomicrobiota bacterium]
MKTKTKFVLSTIIILVLLAVLGIVCVAIHFQPHFVERPIDARFIGQLREVSTLTNIWANNPKDVALRLVGKDLFPTGRPPETDQASAIMQSTSSDRCVVNVLEGFMDDGTNALIATWDRVLLRREGLVWIPSHREVSWQTKNRPGWRNDPLE